LNEFELLLIYDQVFQQLNVPVTIKINNRKILSALAEACGSIELLNTIAIGIDKLDKIGLDKVIDELKNEGINDQAIEKIKAYLHLPKRIDSINELEHICNNNASFAHNPTQMLKKCIQT
jgi:histidyl-tRNA synthetase